MLFKNDDVARAQHNAVRNNVGWYRWTHDLVEVTGKDSTAFLDYLYVNSIGKAAIGKTKYTTMLNEEGKIIDDVIVMHMDENEYWVSTLYAPKLKPWIDAKKENMDVSYKDLTYDVDMYAVQGPNSLVMMNKLLANPIDELKRFSVEDNKIGDIKVKIHRSGFTGELGYEIYCDMSDTKAVCEAIRKAGETMDACEMNILEVYVRSLPMEKGFALRQDMYELTPYEADLGWSVDMSKDFIGKAALEIAKEEGPKKKLFGLEHDIESYEDICQSEVVRLRGVQVGIVKASIYGYTVDKNISFAVLDANKVKVGDRVTIGCNNSPAIVVEKTWI